ncbi:hypothetical protein PI93_019415 [Pandoraea fibrosis]|uniref:Effector protein BipC n=1 Tax=Pandoraea fibrosis TaxID=1891094 RepID=A0ABX6HVK0_9BURK|nr:hypothetical protein [Pandoraea fibrosis]QHE91861.1 hypothetical protein PJ20_008585 [Pandoraea fibrosis]QHF14582.1 hypothetical protein PI93_019415 [Pandoraea fibrosis]
MSIITQNTSASLATVGISSVAPSNIEEKKAAPLRGAAEVARLDGGEAKTRGMPELREPRVGNSPRSTDARLADILGMLMSANLTLSRQSIETIGSNSKMELDLAASNANAQRSAGRAEMFGAFTQAGVMVGGAGVSAQRAMKGSNLQLNATRTDLPKANEAKLFASSPNYSASARANFSDLREASMRTYQEKTFKASKMQTQSEAIKVVGGAATKVAEGSQNAAVSGHRANQAVVAGEASVANRTTDASFKARASIDDFQNSIRALRDSVAQSKDNAAAHIARSA